MLRRSMAREHFRSTSALTPFLRVAVTAPVVFLAILPTARAQQVSAGPGETKTAPPFVMLASDTALKAYEGGRIQATDSRITTTGDDAHGAAAEIGGVIDLTRGSVATDGASAMGLYAHGDDSRIDSSADVATSGSGAHGAFASEGGVVRLSGGTVTTSGADAYGLLADRSGSRIDSAATVATSGPNAIGAAATSGGALAMTGGSVGTAGVASHGLYSTGRGSTVQSAADVSTAGDYSHGVLVEAGGSARLTAGTVSTTGAAAAGLLSDGQGSRLTSSADVSTAGADAIGVYARQNGAVDQAGGSVATTGAAAHGLFATGRNSTIGSTAAVQTAGDAAAGAFADAGGTISLGGSVRTAGAAAQGLLANGAASAIASRADVTTQGYDAYGAQAVNGGAIALASGTIATTGDQAQGIRSIGDGSTVTSAAQVSTAGDRAAGVAALSGGQVQLLGGSVATTGASEGLYAFGLGSTITGAADVAVQADGTAAVLADGRGLVSLTGGLLQTFGSRSFGLAATYGGSVAADGVTVEAGGAGSAGVFVTAASLTLGNSRVTADGAGIRSLGDAAVQISGSTLQVGTFVFDAAFDLAGQAATFTVLNAQLTGTGGLLRVTRGDNGRDGIVTLTLDGSDARGTLSDREARTTGYTAVALTGGSHLTGGLDGIERLDLDRGTWTTAGPTRVASVVIGPRGGAIDTAGASVSLAAPISGAGPLAKTGTGTLALTGDSSLSGPTFVRAGTLSVDGSLRHSPVSVDRSATLTGGGTIGGLVAHAGSAVAPGNGVGQLTVDGDVTFEDGSVYVAELGPGGQADSIEATGRASLAGSVQVRPDQGANYRADAPYTLLRAAAVSGRFGQVTGGDFAFLRPTLGYDANAVVLTLTRRTDPTRATFASVAATRNQFNTADAVEALGAGNRLFDSVLGASVAGARQAFDALSGEAYGSAVTVGYGDAQRIQSAILARLHQPLAPTRPLSGREAAPAAYAAGRPGRAYAAMPVATFDPRRFGLWAEGFGAWGQVNGNGNAAGLETSTGGFMIGADAAYGDTGRIGVAGGFLRTRLDVDARRSSGTSESIFGAIYGTGTWNAVAVRAGASYAFQDVDLDRTVVFPAFSDGTHASYDGWTAQAFGELGYHVEAGAASVEPFVGGAILRLRTGGFAEQGGAAALTGAGQDYDLATTTLGLRAEAGIGAEVPLVVRGMLGWRHAYGDVEPVVLLALGGGSSAFKASGVPVDRDALVAEAGLDWQFLPGFSLGLAYQGQIGGRAQEHGLKGNVTGRF